MASHEGLIHSFKNNPFDKYPAMRHNSLYQSLYGTWAVGKFSRARMQYRELNKKEVGALLVNNFEQQLVIRHPERLTRLANNAGVSFNKIKPWLSEDYLQKIGKADKSLPIKKNKKQQQKGNKAREGSKNKSKPRQTAAKGSVSKSSLKKGSVKQKPAKSDNNQVKESSVSSESGSQKQVEKSESSAVSKKPDYLLKSNSKATTSKPKVKPKPAGEPDGGFDQDKKSKKSINDDLRLKMGPLPDDSRSTSDDKAIELSDTGSVKDSTLPLDKKPKNAPQQSEPQPSKPRRHGSLTGRIVSMNNRAGRHITRPPQYSSNNTGTYYVRGVQRGIYDEAWKKGEAILEKDAKIPVKPGASLASLAEFINGVLVAYFSLFDGGKSKMYSVGLDEKTKAIAKALNRELYKNISMKSLDNQVKNLSRNTLRLARQVQTMAYLSAYMGYFNVFGHAPDNKANLEEPDQVNVTTDNVRELLEQAAKQVKALRDAENERRNGMH